MADHELEIGGKLGIPEFHGFAASIDGRYKGRWGKRTAEVLAAAAQAADLEPDALGAALLDNDGASDLLYRVMNRAVEVSDTQYIAALGRLVGRALDPALIDEVAYLTSELERLEPVHLRVLLMVFVFMDQGQYVDDPAIASVAAAVGAQTSGEGVAIPDVAERLGISELAATRAVDRLSTESLVFRSGVVGKAGQPTLDPGEWAGRALILMFPKLTEVWLGGDNYARR